MFAGLSGNLLPLVSDAALPLDTVVKAGAPIAQDISGVATRSAHAIDVLLWNYADEDLAAPPARLSLFVRDLPRQPIRLTILRMDANHANAYSAWLAIGSPQTLTAAQVAELQSAGELIPLVDPDILYPNDGTAHFSDHPAPPERPRSITSSSLDRPRIETP